MKNEHRRNWHDLPVAVSTGSFWPRPTANSISLLRSASITDIELVLQASELSRSFQGHFHYSLRQHLNDLVRARELTVWAVHAPHMDVEHGHSANVRSAYLAYCLELCAELGGRVLVTHPFHIFVTYEDTLEYLAGTVESVWDVLIPDMRRFLDEAREADIVVTVENIKVWADDRSGFFNHPANVTRFLRDVGSPSMQLTLDVVHAHLAGQLDAFVGNLGEHIASMHAADMVAPNDRVAPGQGELAWDLLLPRLRLLPSLRCVSLELVRGEIEDVQRGLAYLRSRLRDGSQIERNRGGAGQFRR